MNQTEMNKWLQDARVIEEYEVSPGYIVAARRDGHTIGVYALSKSSIRFITSTLTIGQAREAITEYSEWFTAWLNKRRQQAPTPAQLGMLFHWKIPIALDLTFGQAWDIIDTRIKEEKASRRAKLHPLPAARPEQNRPGYLHRTSTGPL